MRSKILVYTISFFLIVPLCMANQAEEVSAISVDGVDQSNCLIISARVGQGFIRDQEFVIQDGELLNLLIEDFRVGFTICAREISATQVEIEVYIKHDNRQVIRENRVVAWGELFSVQCSHQDAELQVTVFKPNRQEYPTPIYHEAEDIV